MRSIPVLETMREEHLDRVMQIESACFSQPYSREIFEEELGLDIAHPKVVRLGKEVVGFIDYWIIRDEVHLINVAIDPLYQRRHLASFLMNHLENVVHERSIKKIFLDVRKSNEGAIRLYEKFGYKEIGLRKKYYSDNNEDAVVMLKTF